MYIYFHKIYYSLPIKLKIAVIYFVFLIIAGSIAEFISLGAIIPFLNSIFNPGSIPFIVGDIYNYFGIDTYSTNSIYIIGIIFSALIVISSALKMNLLSFSTRLASQIGANISEKVFSHVLHMPYLDHMGVSDNLIIATLTSKIDDVIFGFVQPFLILIANTMLFISIISFIIIISPKLSLISIIFFGIFYIVIARLSRRKLDKNGRKITENKNRSISIIRDALGGIRDILLDGVQRIFIGQYSIINIDLRAAQGRNIYIASSPRFVIEAIGLLMIVLLALYMSMEYGATNSIALLGALALGAQRILPILQQMFSSWASIQGSMGVCGEIFSLLSKPTIQKLSYGNVIFNHSIKFDSVSFKYPMGNEYTIQDLNLEIQRGSKVGVIGRSGIGKSTFLDILMGLIPPTKGVVFIDNEELSIKNIQSWGKKIAHVPQSVFLISASFAENIAFGVEKSEIEIDRVVKVAAMAQIGDFIEQYPAQYWSEIKGGLSGGQRQRIGIARALYKNADILIFDEATSALDDQTANSVMKTIYELPKSLTIFISSHRLNTIRNCDYVVKFSENGAEIIQVCDL